PAWAHAADVATLCLLLLGVLVALTGGFRIRLLGVLLSMRSAVRVLLWAAAIAVGRHLMCRRAPIHRDVARRFPEWKKTKCDAALFVSAAAALRTADTFSRRRTFVFLIATTALLTALTAVITAPLVWHLRDAVHDPGDPLLNLWTLDWIAYQLRTDPA